MRIDRLVVAGLSIALMLPLIAAPVRAEDDLVFYWPLDEGSGTTASTAVGSYTGTLYNGPAWILGGGLSFDGINDYIRTDSPVPDSMGVSDQGYTLSASVRVTDPNESGNIIHISNSSAGTGWCIAMLHIRNGYFRAIGWDGNPVTAVDTVPAVTGQWYSIANTWSPETQSLDLYVNGIRVASSPMTTYIAADVPVYIFAGGINAMSCSENQGWFKGDVKDVRIYSRAITQEEAEENSNQSLGSISASLSPANGATEVALDTDLVMTFSTTTVATSTGSIAIYKTGTDELVEAIALTSDRIVQDGAQITIDPSENLEEGTGYYVWVPETAFADALGNAYPGTVSSSTWSFTTVGPPAAETYTLSFDVQGGSLVPAVPGIEAGDGVTLPSAPARDGYAFQNWNTVANGSGTAYGPGAPYFMPGADTTFFAIWQESGDIDDEEDRSSLGRRSGGRRVVPQQPLPAAVQGLVAQHRSLFLQAQAAGIALPQSVLDLLGIADTTPTGLCPRYAFTRDLRFGDEGEDVGALQRFLNCAGFRLADSGPGAPGEETLYFVERTRESVIRFQERYFSEILVPIDAQSGTGIFAQYSRTKAHSLMAP